MEGRKQTSFTSSDAHPMIDKNGKLVLTPKDKVDLITDTFERKFAAPALNDPSVDNQDPNNIPLPPFRQRHMGTFEPIRLAEMRLAIAQLKEGKAPGPDGYPVEFYKRLPSLHPYLLALLNKIYESGEIPTELRAIYVAPIAKPGKDARDPANKRPISLINSIMKVMEGILYHRMLPLVEPRLYHSQYAYRHSRSTEHHLTSILDHVHRALLSGSDAYAISFDIAGAFDNVPHYQLMLSMKKFGVDSYTQRIVRNWLRGRFF